MDYREKQYICCSQIIVWGAYLICFLTFISCSSVQFATTEHWQWDKNTTTLSAAKDGLFFAFNELDTCNLQTCYEEPLHVITAQNAANNQALPYVQHVLQDLPFQVDSVLCVLGDKIVIFEQRTPAVLHPDYEIDSDSVVMLMTGETFRPSREQRADVIWRNIFVNTKEKRMVCLDRFHIRSRHVCVMYIAQSNAKILRPYHAYNWCGYYTWDISAPRNIMLANAFLEACKMQSLNILHRH